MKTPETVEFWKGDSKTETRRELGTLIARLDQYPSGSEFGFVISYVKYDKPSKKRKGMGISGSTGWERLGTKKLEKAKKRFARRCQELENHEGPIPLKDWPDGPLAQKKDSVLGYSKAAVVEDQENEPGVARRKVKGDAK